VVVRRDVVGNPDHGAAPAVRAPAAQPASGGPLVAAQERGGGPVRAAAQAGRLPPRPLRPDARVLATGGRRATLLPRNPPLPAAQKPRLRPYVKTVRARKTNSVCLDVRLRTLKRCFVCLIGPEKKTAWVFKITKKEIRLYIKQTLCLFLIVNMISA
jgi:hypothetical protein